MASIVYALILLFFIVTLSVLITQNVIIPSVINYEHGLLNHPDFGRAFNASCANNRAQ